jgi:hypothetical protein
MSTNIPVMRPPRSLWGKHIRIALIAVAAVFALALILSTDPTWLNLLFFLAVVYLGVTFLGWVRWRLVHR